MTEPIREPLPELPDTHCQYIKPDGSRCGGYPTKAGGKHCFVHDPSLADIRQEANAKGGRAKRERNLKPIKITDIRQIPDVIEETINAIRAGQLSHQEGMVIERLLYSYMRFFNLGK